MIKFSFEERRALTLKGRNARKVAMKDGSAVVYLYELAGVPYAVAYIGRQGKPCWHFRFRSDAERTKRVSDFFASMQGRAQRKAAAKVEKPKLQVGHILVASWGYDQTNIDYWQVVELVGKASVRVRPIARKDAGDAGWAGHDTGACVPDPDAFTGESILRRVNRGDGVRIDSCRYASLWNMKPNHWTAYA